MMRTTGHGRHWTLIASFGALIVAAGACGSSDADPGGQGGQGAQAGAGGQGGAGGQAPEPVCEPGETRPCYEGPEATEDVGLCVGGAETCLEDGSGWSECQDQVLPAASDDCAAIGDEDCDGIACSEAAWVTGIGGTGNFSSYRVVVDPMGNTIALGRSSGSIEVGSDSHDVANGVAVVKVDPDGTPIWSRVFAAPTGTRSRRLAVDETGAVYVTGTFRNTINFGPTSATELVGLPSDDDIFVVKLDPNGDHVWSRYLSGRAGQTTFDPQGNKDVYGIVVDDSGVYLAGRYNGHFGGVCFNACDPAEGNDAWLRKLSRADGSNIWGLTGGSPQGDAFDALDVGPDGSGIVVAGTHGATATFGGTTLPVVGERDVFVLRIDADGNVVWAQGLGAAGGNGYPWSVDATSDGVVVGGIVKGALTADALLPATGTEFNGFAALLGTNGTPQWGRVFGAENAVLFETNAILDSTGSVYLAGGFTESVTFGDTTVEVPTGESGGHLTKLDPTGEPLWTRSISSPGHDVWIYDLALGLDDHPHALTVATGPYDLAGVMVPHDGGEDGAIARIQP